MSVDYCMLFLDNSPASEFYMPTFRNTLSHLHRQVGVKNELGRKCLLIIVCFFWVIPRCLNFICRRFGTLSHLHRQVGVKNELGRKCLLIIVCFFWVIPRRLNFICRRFGTLCPIFIGR